MRAGANWVQHTLTPAAQSVLKHAIAEARRRGHAQVQPLHVAAMLLTHSESRLREAWMHAGPTPLRALEVCFNVALAHLAQSGPAAPSQPTLSNALVAALKRAHAHQRRGCCPEQQQPPLLAVKVELEQLIISVLDDPSVSRVIKEAGSSSAHIKGNLEDNNNSNPLISLTPSTTGCLPCTSSLPGLRPSGKPCSKPEFSSLSMNGFMSFRAVSSPQSTTYFTSFRPGANSPLSVCEQMESKDTSTQTELLMGSSSVKLQEPVKACDKTILGLQLSSPGVGSQGLQVQQQKVMPDEPAVELGGKENDICRLMEILLRSTKRNALLVVDSDSSACASAILKDLVLRIKAGQVPEQFHGLQVLEPQLSSSSFALCSQLEIEQKLGELSRIVDECMPGGAVLHLGDLQWLSDPVQVKKGTASFCPAQHAVAELERLLLRHAGSRLWFVGVATQQVFARCQARHPELEGRWGLQPLQVASTASPSSSASQQLDKLVKDPGSASQGLYPVHGKIPNEGPTVRPSYGDGEVGDKLQCCTECLAKFEQERHQLHEHERLSLHLAPAEWCSLSSGGALNEGQLDTHSSQVKSQSVIQKLKELQRKWQGTCQSVHAHLHAPVSSSLKTEPSPLGQKLANGSLVDGKTHRLGSVTFPPCAVRQGNSMGSPLSKKHSQVPLTLPRWAQSSSCRVDTGNPMTTVQADAPPCAKDKRGDVVCTSDIGGPNDKSSVISASAEQDIMPGTSVTLAQNGASQMLVQTDLALGQPSASLVSSCSVSLQNTTVSGNPLQRRPQWQIHQERMQERTGNASPLRGFPWQMASSKGTQPKTLVTNTPAPGINQGPPLSSQERITDRLKGLYKALLSRVGWQGEAVAAITSTVMNCRSGMGWMRGVVPKIDSWLLLLGPDPVAKRLIAKALAEIVAGSEENLVFLGFGDQAVSKLETDRNGVRCRGRSSLDRLVEAVRMKPISVLLLEDIDKADTVVRGSLLRAMERGKMADSSGREVNFGNVIVLMTSSIGAEDLVPEQSLGSLKFLEEKLVDLGGGTMRLLVEDTHSSKVIFQSQNNTAVFEREAVLLDTEEANGELVHPVNGSLKRKVDWPILRQPEQRVQLKRPKLSFSQRQALVLDLNLLAEENEDSLSSATTGQSQKACRRNQAEDEDMTRDRVLGCARDRLSDKFCELLDYAVVLKPYDFFGVAGRVLAQLTKAFERITTQGASLEVDVTVLEHILAVIWWGSTVFDTWVADVVGKSVAAVLADVSIAENTVIKLVGDSEHGCRRGNTRESIFSGPQLPLFIEISRST